MMVSLADSSLGVVGMNNDMVAVIWLQTPYYTQNDSLLQQVAFDGPFVWSKDAIRQRLVFT